MKRQGKSFTDDFTRIKYEAERYFAGGAFDLYEDERFIATLQASHCALEIAYGKAVLSCWGEDWSRAWRVMACESAADVLHLHCTSKMGQVKCAIELRREGTDAKFSTSRRDFAGKMAALIETHFVDLKVSQISKARHDWRHLSCLHTRLILKEPGNTIAGVAVSKSQAQTQIDAALSAGLIWLEALRGRGEPIKRLMLFVPAGQAFTIACRLLYVQPENATISLYEMDEPKRSITPVLAFAQTDLLDNLKSAARRAWWAPAHSPSGEVENFIAELNHLVVGAIDTQERNGWIYLAIRGLTFARISAKQLKVEFGWQLPRKRLTQENRGEFENLILAIDENRRARMNSPGNDLFRAQGERWLEALIRRDVAIIDPMLDARFVYSQVPAYRGEQRSFIDLLTVTRNGQLVVMELKVSEDAEFPFQGLDYWMRIDWHRLRGDFERRGYFNGIKLLDAPPLLYLVAPLFRFHATTKLMARAISPRVPIYRIGINEDWRSGVRVLLNERLNP